MKIQSTKIFDATTIEDQELAQKLGPLIQHINAFSENIIRCLRNEVNLEDQIKGEQFNAQIKSGKATSIILKSRDVVGIIPLRVSNGDTIKSFGWQFGNKGPEITLELGVSEASQVSFFAFYR